MQPAEIHIKYIVIWLLYVTGYENKLQITETIDQFMTCPANPALVNLVQ
jgi:hypothetical protein